MAPTRAHAHTHTHTQKYAILSAFPRQQWSGERASMLLYTYIACLVKREVGPRRPKHVAK